MVEVEEASLLGEEEGSSMVVEAEGASMVEEETSLRRLLDRRPARPPRMAWWLSRTTCGCGGARRSRSSRGPGNGLT
jgi:hypothetical protein